MQTNDFDSARGVFFLTKQITYSVWRLVYQFSAYFIYAIWFKRQKKILWNWIGVGSHLALLFRLRMVFCADPKRLSRQEKRTKKIKMVKIFNVRFVLIYENTQSTYTIQIQINAHKQSATLKLMCEIVQKLLQSVYHVPRIRSGDKFKSLCVNMVFNEGAMAHHKRPDRQRCGIISYVDRVDCVDCVDLTTLLQIELPK